MILASEELRSWIDLIIQTAEEEGRDLTPSEKCELDDLHAEIMRRLTVQGWL